MFGFLKKIFGGAPEATVQVEQVPYKVETPVLEEKVAAVNAQPIEKPVQEAPRVEAKPAGKKPAGKKPAARGRKPAAPKAK
jgi:hypothetical protein